MTQPALRRLSAGLVAVAALAVGAACEPFKPPPIPPAQEQLDAEAGIAQAQAALGPRTLGTPGYAVRNSQWGGAYLLPLGFDHLDVYYDDDDLPVAWYRSVAFHEYGHVWDAKTQDTAERLRIMQIMGWTGNWWGGVHEAYADVFMFLWEPGSVSGYGTQRPMPEQAAALRAEGLVP